LRQAEDDVGLDMGDRYSHYCCWTRQEVVEQGRMQSAETALRRHFEPEPACASPGVRHALAWVSHLLIELGHRSSCQRRKIPAITGSESKSDRNDAEKLARFAAYDPSWR